MRTLDQMKTIFLAIVIYFNENLKTVPIDLGKLLLSLLIRIKTEFLFSGLIPLLLFHIKETEPSDSCKNFGSGISGLNVLCLM
jgi:hypothetical protein